MKSKMASTDPRQEKMRKKPKIIDSETNEDCSCGDFDKKKKPNKKNSRMQTKGDVIDSPLGTKKVEGPEVDNDVVSVSDDCNEVCVIQEQHATGVANDNEAEDWFRPLHFVSGGRHGTPMLKILKSKGIIPNVGKWNTAEVNQLHENMVQFLRSYQVRNFRRLVLPQTKEDRAFRKDTQFCLCVCKGIQRTQNNISHRVLIQYSHFMKKGEFSNQEKEDLIKLRDVDGKTWKEIGSIMNRMHIRLGQGYRYHSNPWNHGKWTKEEDRLLKQAIKPYYSKEEAIPWVTISPLVGTRAPHNCANRWSTLLKRPQIFEEMEEEINVNDFTEANEEQLVFRIQDLGVDDEDLIDWTEFGDLFDKTFTPVFLRCRFGAIKKQVAQSHLLEFPELMDQLVQSYEEKKQQKDVMQSVLIKKRMEQVEII